MTKTVSRSYNQPDLYVDVNHVYTPLVGSAPSNYSVSELTKLRHGGYIGVYTVGYHEKRRRGEFVPKRRYLKWDITQDNPQGTYGGTYVKLTSPAKSYHYDVNSVRSVVGSSDSKEQMEGHVDRMAAGISLAALQQEALSNLAPALDALTEASEFHKGLSLLLNARRTAKDLIGQALRGGLSTAKAAGSAWLQWRYGWEGLGRTVSDVEEFLRYPAKGGAIWSDSARVSREEIETRNDPFSGYYVKHDYVSNLHRSLGVNVSVTVKFDVATLNFAANPLLTAWELTPYSWVADWFISVGDMLKAWHVLASASHFTSSVGYHFEELGEASVSNVELGTGTYATSPRASGTATSKAEYRSRMPLGKLRNVPQLRTRLNSKRIADAAALLVTRIF